jgi:hypothetical protein
MPTSGGPADSTSSTTAAAALVASANAGDRSRARQLTSGHSCRAVLARPARPPAVGSASGDSSASPNAPSSRATVANTAPPARPAARSLPAADFSQSNPWRLRPESGPGATGASSTSPASALAGGFAAAPQVNTCGLNPALRRRSATAPVSGSAAPTTQNSAPAASGSFVRGALTSRSTNCGMLRSMRSVLNGETGWRRVSLGARGGATAPDFGARAAAPRAASGNFGSWCSDSCTVSGTGASGFTSTRGVTGLLSRLRLTSGNEILAGAGPCAPARKPATSRRVCRVPRCSGFTAGAPGSRS